MEVRPPQEKSCAPATETPHISSYTVFAFSLHIVQGKFLPIFGVFGENMAKILKIFGASCRISLFMPTLSFI